MFKISPSPNTPSLNEVLKCCQLDLRILFLEKILQLSPLSQNRSPCVQDLPLPHPIKPLLYQVLQCCHINLRIVFFFGQKVHIYIYMNVAFMACTCAGCNPSNIMWNIYLKKYVSFLIKKRRLFGHWPFEKKSAKQYLRGSLKTNREI